MAKIMLVEDDISLLEIYKTRLQAEGYEIFTARDGEEALTLAKRELPDLIICDIMMPKISGFDMLDILRDTPETKNVKIIMMTALSQAEDKTRADKLGADRYLVKSQVTLEDVARATRDVLGNTSESSADMNLNPALPPTPSTPGTPDVSADNTTATAADFVQKQTAAPTASAPEPVDASPTKIPVITDNITTPTDKTISPPTDPDASTISSPASSDDSTATTPTESFTHSDNNPITTPSNDSPAITPAGAVTPDAATTPVPVDVANKIDEDNVDDPIPADYAPEPPLTNNAAVNDDVLAATNKAQTADQEEVAIESKIDNFVAKPTTAVNPTTNSTANPTTVPDNTTNFGDHGDNINFKNKKVITPINPLGDATKPGTDLKKMAIDEGHFTPEEFNMPAAATFTPPHIPGQTLTPQNDIPATPETPTPENQTPITTAQ